MKTTMLFLFAGIVCVSGCGLIRVYEPPAYNYYLNPDKDIQTIGRVALIELASYSVLPDLSIAVTESLYQEIQKKQIFSMVMVSLDDPAWDGVQITIDENYSFEELILLRDIFKCDAILVGTITDFEAYPHMAIGLRLRLIDLSDGGLCWAMEQVWDTTDKNTRERIEAYYNPVELLHINDENLGGQLGSVSTLKFLKFVSYEIASTMHY